MKLKSSNFGPALFPLGFLLQRREAIGGGGGGILGYTCFADQYQADRDHATYYVLFKQYFGTENYSSI